MVRNVVMDWVLEIRKKEIASTTPRLHNWMNDCGSHVGTRICLLQETQLAAAAAPSALLQGSQKAPHSLAAPSQ